MKLYSIIRVVLDEDEVQARPNVIEEVHRALSRLASSEASTANAVTRATLLVTGHRRVFAEVRTTGGMVDGVLVLAATECPDDLRGLLRRLLECAPANGADYRVLGLTAERLSSGIHFVLEMRAQSPSGRVRIFLSGRLAELRPHHMRARARTIIDCHEAAASAA